MTDSKAIPAKPSDKASSHAARARAAREERRAKALRANLGRRKEQTRARAKDDSDPKKSG